MSDCQSLAAQARSIMDEYLRSKAVGTPYEEKWPLGDLALELTDEECDEVASLMGGPMSGAKLRSYREVARAWPPETRVEASWTTHRTLKGEPDRVEKITPGMTLREAQKAAGKVPTNDPEGMPLTRRVSFVAAQLQDKEVNAAVRNVLHDRAAARASRTAKMVTDDQGAEFKEKLRALRQTRDAKSPEVAATEAARDIRDIVEYVRAISRASIGESAFLPQHSLPDRVFALRDLGRTVVAALQLMSDQSPEARESLAVLAGELRTVSLVDLDGGSISRIIVGEAVDISESMIIDSEVG